jgi:hypothetical protein
MERGDFYASTGVVLDEVTATEKSLAVKVRAAGTSKYRVQFIGRGGQVLSEVGEPSASYTFKGTEGYVRAKVLESNGAPRGSSPSSCAAATLPPSWGGLRRS